MWLLLFAYSRCASSLPEISEATTDTRRIAPEGKIMVLLVLHQRSRWAWYQSSDPALFLTNGPLTGNTKSILKWQFVCVHAKSLQFCPTLCDPVDCWPGTSAHGILQARILEWVAMPLPRGSSWSRGWTRISEVYLLWHLGSLPLAPPGNAKWQIRVTLCSVPKTLLPGKVWDIWFIFSMRLIPSQLHL